MYQLDPEEYVLAQPLFAKMGHHLALDAIVEGHTPAWVYVDDPVAPRTAWMWDLQGEMYLAGAADRPATNHALGELVTARVIPHAQARGVPGLALFHDTAAWGASLPAILPGLEPQQVARRYYTFSRPAIDWQDALPAGSASCRLDEGWLARRDVANMEHLVGWIDSFWHSHAQFLRYSFGFFLLDGDTVASWCLGVFASGQQVELAVATVPEFRGQGYATAVATRSVAFCAEQGLTPHWHCWDDNVASWRVAERIGFVHPTPYKVYYVDIRRSPTGR